jgi:hypothetical protein
MALRAINLANTKVVELDTDPDKGTEDASRFTIKTLDSRLCAHLIELARSGTVEALAKVVSFGLVAVENFADVDGNDLKLRMGKENIGGKEYERLAPDVVSKIHFQDQNLLSHEIFAFNKLTETDAKN